MALTGALSLVVLVFVGTYWAWKFFARSTVSAGLVLLFGYLAMGGALSPVMAATDPFYPYAPIQVSRVFTGVDSILPQPFTGSPSYLDSCILQPGHSSSSIASGYYLISYGTSKSFSEAYCNGLAFLQLETYASGIAASASAKSSIWWTGESIHVPVSGMGSQSSLNVLLTFSIGGWQTPVMTSLYANSQVNLWYAMKLVRDDGYQEALFTTLLPGRASFGGMYDPVYTNIRVQNGHSYNIVVVFNATAYSRVSGPTGIATTETCFGNPSSCGKIPQQIEGNGVCPTGVASYMAKCFYLEWDYTDYNITNIP